MSSIFRNQLKFCLYEGYLYLYEVFKGNQETDQKIDCHSIYGHRSAPFVTSQSKN